MNRAVGVVESWLDAPLLDDELRQALHASLAVLVAEGVGAELTAEELVKPSGELACRDVSWRDTVVPLLCVMATLSMTDAPDVEAVVLFG
jgi:hypothetical protein